MQVASLQHKLNTQGPGHATERIAGAKQALLLSARSEKKALEEMRRMVDDFASQTRQQLDELRREREEFEARFTRRLNEIAVKDPRDATAAAATPVAVMRTL